MKFVGSLLEKYNPFKQYVGLKYTGANAPYHPATLDALQQELTEFEAIMGATASKQRISETAVSSLPVVPAKSSGKSKYVVKEGKAYEPTLPRASPHPVQLF